MSSICAHNFTCGKNKGSKCGSNVSKCDPENKYCSHHRKLPSRKAKIVPIEIPDIPEEDDTPIEPPSPVDLPEEKLSDSEDESPDVVLDLVCDELKRIVTLKDSEIKKALSNLISMM